MCILLSININGRVVDRKSFNYSIKRPALSYKFPWLLRRVLTSRFINILRYQYVIIYGDGYNTTLSYSYIGISDELPKMLICSLKDASQSWRNFNRRPLG